MGRWVGRWVGRGVGRRVGRRVGRWVGRRVGRWVGRWVGRQAGRWVGRQAGRQGGSPTTHPGTYNIQQTNTQRKLNFTAPHTLRAQGLQYPARETPHSDMIAVCYSQPAAVQSFGVARWAW